MKIAEAIAQGAAPYTVRRRDAVPLVRGQVFPIRLTPDLLAGDRFNIGVGFVDAAGVVHCKIADDFSRLRCLYDERVDIDSFLLLRDIVHADLAGTMWVSSSQSPSENIEYGQALPGAGISIDEILERSYSAWVPFGATRSERPDRTVPILNDALQRRMQERLKSLLGPKAARLFSREGIKIPTSSGRGAIIRFPIQNRINGTAADIVSAWTKQPTTVKSNLHQAVTNFLAIRYAERNERFQRSLGLFVLAPEVDSGFDGKVISSVRNTVEDLTTFARNADVHVVTAASEEALAERLSGWQPLAA